MIPPAAARRGSADGGLPALRRIYRLDGDHLSLGRDASNGLVLDEPRVSRFHAALSRQGEAWRIEDLHSTHGTLVAHQPIRGAVTLRDGDLIEICGYRLVYRAAGVASQPFAASRAEPALVGLPLLEVVEGDGGVRLDAADLWCYPAVGGAPLLRGVSLAVKPRELVAVVGPSGSGKSTLLRALSATAPAGRGTVLVNGADLYAHAERLRPGLGFVPQDDIIHTQLTLGTALELAAALRLPDDTGAHELRQRVAAVLGSLQLDASQHLRIDQLSGGQRKRANLAVELLTRPRLLFLDEPTSGLDPALEHELMCAFRALADGGHTVVLVTHETRSLLLCDQVAFLAPGGTLAYYGPPHQLAGWFGVGDIAAAYQRLVSSPPGDWAHRFASSELCAALLVGRLAEVGLQPAEHAAAPARLRPASSTRPERVGAAPDRRATLSGAGAWRTVPGPGAGRSLWRQLCILVRRQAALLLSEPRNLALMLLQAPVIAGLLAMAFEPDVVDLVTGSQLQARALAFLLTCCCIWLGTSNAAREICKEAPLLAREQAAGLSAYSYVLSKAVALGAVCVLQSLALGAVVAWRVQLPDLGPGTWERCGLVLVLSSWGGLALGLLLSAMVSNPDKAQSLVPVAMIPQLVLGGTLVPLGGLPSELSWLTLSRWGSDMLAQALRVGELPPPLPLAGTPAADLACQVDLAGHCAFMVAAVCALLLASCLVLRMRNLAGMRALQA